MTTKRKTKFIANILNRLLSILPAFFWIFLIFGFEDAYIALLSIGAAAVHEMGHILCIFIKRGRLNLRSVVSGLRIRKTQTASYRHEMITYLCGPLVNLIIFVICSLIAPLIGGIMWDIAMINLATAISNLLPIEGYDGYGILRCMLLSHERSEQYVGILKRLSSSLTFLFCVFSLYLIDRMGGGYWIFGVFFISTIKCIKDDLKS